MLCRQISRLTPAAREAAQEFIVRLNNAKITYFINETYRDQAVQDAYYAQGRVSDIKVLNELREKAGLYLFAEDDPEWKKIITKTKISVHSSGKALDIAPSKDGKNPWWAAPQSEWDKIAKIGKEVGFSWGGDWKDFQDCPHYQWDK